MIEKIFLDKVEAFVHELQKHESTGHDYFHVQRVVNNVKKILLHEKADENYTILLAWLHDVGDYKIHDGKDKTAEILTPFLIENGWGRNKIEQLLKDISLISYKGGFNESTDKIEIKIVQDADKLDALGAIGIARTFAYGGKNNRLIYDPNFERKSSNSADEYKNNSAPTLEHFYDKLLKLKNLMNTETAKKIAEERHAFMLKYLEQFYMEWKE